MSTSLIKMSVASYRRIESPLERDGKRLYVAAVRALDLASELDNWRGINPRDPALTSGVARKIKESLQEDPRAFFFKNRGITLIVEKSEFDGENKVLRLEMSNPNLHGMLDGGHTYKVVREHINSLKPEDVTDISDAYVRVEILEGFTDIDEVVDIVEARNTSTQVKDQSIEELRNHFDAIHQVLDKMPYGQRIAYKEIELADDGSKKDIDIKEILSYLICFDTESFDGKKHPIMAYSGKGAVLKHFKNKADALGKYFPLLPAILELHDRIYAELPGTYNEAAGGKFGRLMGVDEGKEELPFIGETSDYSIPSAFIYPLLAAMRNLVKIDGGRCSWKANPIKFFDSIKEELAQRVVEQAKEFRNPTKLGKDNATWGRCYDLVELEVLKRSL